MSEREKIAQIIAEHLCPQGKAHKTLYGVEKALQPYRLKAAKEEKWEDKQ